MERGVSTAAQQVKNLTYCLMGAFRSLTLLSGLRIQHCHELWYRLQMQLRSQVAVAVV